MDKKQFYVRFGELLAEPSFLTLSKQLQDDHPYFFVNFYEQDHSRFIVWLLDPSEGHGLGDFFLQHFLHAIVQGQADAKQNKLTHQKVSSWSLSDFLFETEKKAETKIKNGSIDIYGLSLANKVLLVIENKIGSKEHGGQLETYSKYADLINEQHSNVETIVRVLLDAEFNPDDSIVKIAARDEWSKVNYDWIAIAIREVIDNELASPVILKMLDSYLYEIEGYVSDEKQSTLYITERQQLKVLAHQYRDVVTHEVFKKAWSYELNDLLNSSCEQDELHVAKAQYQHLCLFDFLRDYGVYDWIEQALAEDGMLIEFDDKRLNFCHVDILKVVKLNSDTAEWWPLYFKVVQSKESSTYSISLNYHEKHLLLEPEDKSKITKIIMKKYKPKNGKQRNRLINIMLQNDIPTKDLIGACKKQLRRLVKCF